VAWIVVAREFPCALGGLDIGEPDDAPLRLRDRLLGNDDDVPVLELDGLGDQGAEVVALGDLRQALDGNDAQLADASTTSASARRAAASRISVLVTTARTGSPSRDGASASSTTSTSISPS
jgi:hypothetical protein